MSNMTTTVEPATIHWGKRAIIAEEVAVTFYGSLCWLAFANGQKWAKENNGRLDSAHGVLETRIEEAKFIPDLSGPAWGMRVTANSEEDVGIDTEGRFGKKGGLVGLVIHGGGIMLGSPESLQAAYTNRTPQGEPSINQAYIDMLLAGTLPNGQGIRIYTLDQLMKEEPAKLPPIYAIAAPLQEFSETQSGLVAVDKLPKVRLFVARAGHPQTAEDYAKALETAGVREYGNHHSLKQANPNNPSGRVLLANSNYYLGLNGNLNIGDDARFVGVRASGAGGAAPQKGDGSTLDELFGKARELGNGVLVINARDISPAAYKALTRTE